MEGIITLKLDGATLSETERCRLIVHTLFQQGVLNVKNGSVILHFDHEGVLQEIEVHKKQWRRNKPPLSVAKTFSDAKVESLMQ